MKNKYEYAIDILNCKIREIEANLSMYGSYEQEITQQLQSAIKLLEREGSNDKK